MSDIHFLGIYTDLTNAFTIVTIIQQRIQH